MFEKLFMLVKNNAGMAVVHNPVIPAKYHEAIMNEASSSIIDVLKNQMESGKLKDMIKYFQFPGIYNNPLINSTVNKFANRLDQYGLAPAEALMVAKELIPPVMQQMIERSRTDQNDDLSLGKLLAMLSGNYNINNLLGQLAVA